jgi:streptogramin lyase
MRLFEITQILATFASLVTAGVTRRQAAATTTIYNGTGFITAVAARQNGQLLLTYGDKNELWTLDPSTSAASKLVSYPGVTCVVGITEYAPDIFAVVTGNYTGVLSTGISPTSGTWGIWKLDMTGPSPNSTFVSLISDAEYLFGVTTLNNDIVFAADPSIGAVFKFDMNTGNSTLVLHDTSMVAPLSAPLREGIHGIGYYNETVYFANIFGTSFNKFRIDPATGEAVGEVVPILAGLEGPEGFSFDSDGSIYLTQLFAGTITKILPNLTESVVASVPSCTFNAFGRTTADNNTLYVSTGDGKISAVAIS